MSSLRYLIIFLYSLSGTLFAVEPISTETNDEWVVVLNDQRPARLKGWSRTNYSGTKSYKQSLELKRFADNIAQTYALDVAQQWLIESLDVYCLVVRFKNDHTETLEKLRLDKKVRWVQKSNAFTLRSNSSINQFDNNLLSPPELSLPKSLNGSGARIAIVDSAIDLSHVDLAGKISKNLDLLQQPAKVSNGEPHGTAMASVMVADPNSQLGISGIADEATVSSFRACWEADGNDTNCDTLSIARALDAVVNEDIDILNLSLSGPRDELLDSLISTITEQGTRVVAAYDNSRAASQRFPSPAPNVLIVGSQKRQNQQLQPVFTAPGSRLVAAPGQTVSLMGGDSIATAYTTAILALCKQAERRIGSSVCDFSQLNNNVISQPGFGLEQLITQINAAIDSASQ